MRFAPAARSTHQRLSEAVTSLDRIEQLQAGDFGRFLEDQIVWRELVELELQNVDEQIERITATAGDRAA
jgi:hypothetical protein